MSKNNIDIYDAIPSVRHLIEENIKLKKENQELKEKNLKISIENNNSKIVEEMNKTVVENKNKQLLEATELNITYLDKIIMLKKAIKLLKEYIMYEELDEILEKYPDLKEVFESVGEE